MGGPDWPSSPPLSAAQGVGDSKTLIEFRLNRSRAGPLGFLGDWCGTLITDGYAGYDKVIRRDGIVRVGCLAHAQRKARAALAVARSARRS